MVEDVDKYLLVALARPFGARRVESPGVTAVAVLPVIVVVVGEARGVYDNYRIISIMAL